MQMLFLITLIMPRIHSYFNLYVLTRAVKSLLLTADNTRLYPVLTVGWYR